MIHSLRGHTQRVWDVSVSSDGTRLASSSKDKSIRLWSLTDGSLEAVLRGHRLGVNDLVFRPDGKLLASVASETKFWEIPNNPEVHRLSTAGPVETLAFDSAGKRLVTSSGHTVVVWAADRGQPLFEWNNTQGAVGCAIFGSDASKLIVGLEDGSLRILDVVSAAETRTQKLHTESVRALALSGDNHHLASASWDGQVVLWDARKEEVRHVLEGHTQIVWTLAFNYDASTLTSASMDGTVKLWDVATGACILTYAAHTSGVYSAAFSPDGSRIASASNDGTFRLWDPQSGETLRTVNGSMEDVWSIAFSPDGKRLATGARDRTVRIWDAESGDELLILRGPTGTVMRVAWSSDGRRIAAGSWNRELFIWDASIASNPLSGPTSETTNLVTIDSVAPEASARRP
jgi:WD40 repeat protein